MQPSGLSSPAAWQERFSELEVTFAEFELYHAEIETELEEVTAECDKANRRYEATQRLLLKTRQEQKGDKATTVKLIEKVAALSDQLTREKEQLVAVETRSELLVAQNRILKEQALHREAELEEALEEAILLEIDVSEHRASLAKAKTRNRQLTHQIKELKDEEQKRRVCGSGTLTSASLHSLSRPRASSYRFKTKSFTLPRTFGSTFTYTPHPTTATHRRHSLSAHTIPIFQDLPTTKFDPQLNVSRKFATEPYVTAPSTPLPSLLSSSSQSLPSSSWSLSSASPVYGTSSRLLAKRSLRRQLALLAKERENQPYNNADNNNNNHNNDNNNHNVATETKPRSYSSPSLPTTSENATTSPNEVLRGTSSNASSTHFVYGRRRDRSSSLLTQADKRGVLERRRARNAHISYGSPPLVNPHSNQENLRLTNRMDEGQASQKQQSMDKGSADAQDPAVLGLGPSQVLRETEQTIQ